MIRIVAIPITVMCFYSSLEYARPIACLIFGVAGITDMLDGYVARKMGQISRFGEFLDPVADKLMVTICLVLLVQADPRLTLTVVAMIIIGREITISALREWMAGIGSRAKVSVSMGGKIKTFLQMFGIGCMVYERDFLGLQIYDIGVVFLILAAGMTIWSMIAYLRAAWPVISENQ